MASTIALADAKAELSAVIRRVNETGSEYIVTVRNKPCAMIIPMPKPTPKKLKAYGILAGKRPVATREQEKSAYAEAMESKYGNPA